MCHANVLGLPQRKVLHLQGIFFCQRQLDQRCSVLLGLGFDFFFFCHNSLLLKNVILMKQKLLRKSYWFWQLCLEGSWGGMSWKCWSSQLWHFLNGKEFWFISFSPFKMMFQNVLFHGKERKEKVECEWNAWKKKGDQIFWLIQGSPSAFNFATSLVFRTTQHDLKIVGC